jgi:hypothetical protein
VAQVARVIRSTHLFQAHHCLRRVAVVAAGKPLAVQAVRLLVALVRFQVQREQLQVTRHQAVAVRETRQHRAAAVQELFT